MSADTKYLLRALFNNLLLTLLFQFTYCAVYFVALQKCESCGIVNYTPIYIRGDCSFCGCELTITEDVARRILYSCVFSGFALALLTVWVLASLSSSAYKRDWFRWPIAIVALVVNIAIFCFNSLFG